MKYLLISLVSLSFMGCSQLPVGAEGAPENSPVTFAFKSIDSSRNVNSAYNGPAGGVTWNTGKGAVPTPVAKAPKKGKKTVVVMDAPKFIAVSACKPGQPCTGEEKQKLVPREAFVSNIREKIKKSGDLVDKQEHLLAKDLDLLKNEKQVMIKEQAYYEHEMKMNKWSSLKPVIDGYKKAHVGITKDIALFEMKIQKYEKELNYLRNMKTSPVANLPVEKIMLLVDAGQWEIGSDLSPSDRVLWNLMQTVGAEVSATN
jgi:hypothetical protein